MPKKPKKIKIIKVIFGLSECKNIGNYESLKVHNELEAVVGEGDSVAEIHEQLKQAVLQMNEHDFNSMLNK